MEASLVVHLQTFILENTIRTAPLCKNVLRCAFAFQDLDRLPVHVLLEQSFQRLFVPNRENTAQMGYVYLVQYSAPEEHDQYLVPDIIQKNTLECPSLAMFRHSHTHTTQSGGRCWGQGRPVCFSAVPQRHISLYHFPSLCGRSHPAARPHAQKVHLAVW